MPESAAALADRQPRAHHDHHPRKAQADGHPALPVHRFLEEQPGADHDEQRPGKSDGGHVGQRNARQRQKPQHQPGGVQGPADELPSHGLGPPGPQAAAASHQRQQHQQAEQVAQELRLERVQVQGQRAHQRIEHAEDQAGAGRPQQASHGGRQVRGAPMNGVVNPLPGRRTSGAGHRASSVLRTAVLFALGAAQRLMPAQAAGLAAGGRKNIGWWRATTGPAKSQARHLPR